MPDVISDTNGKLCVGSYHMWRLLSNPDNYSLSHLTHVEVNLCTHDLCVVVIVVCWLVFL